MSKYYKLTTQFSQTNTRAHTLTKRNGGYGPVLPVT